MIKDIVLSRVYHAPWAKRVVHQDRFLVQVIQDSRIAVFGEMVTEFEKGPLYGRYTIGAEDQRGGVSKAGVRKPGDIIEGCSVIDVTLRDDWSKGHNLQWRLDKAQDRAEESSSIEEIEILHPIHPVKVREEEEDFRPLFLSPELAEEATHLSYFALGLAPARYFRRVVANALVIAIPSARALWKWYSVETFDDYAASKANYPRHAYQHLRAASVLAPKGVAYEAV